MTMAFLLDPADAVEALRKVVMSSAMRLRSWYLRILEVACLAATWRL